MLRLMGAGRQRYARHKATGRKLDARVEGHDEQPGMIHGQAGQFAVEDRDEEGREIIRLGLFPQPPHTIRPRIIDDRTTQRDRPLEILGDHPVEDGTVAQSQVVEIDRQIAGRMTDQRDQMLGPPAMRGHAADGKYVLAFPRTRLTRADHDLPPDRSAEARHGHGTVDDRDRAFGQRRRIDRETMGRAGDAAAIAQRLARHPIVPAAPQTDRRIDAVVKVGLRDRCGDFVDDAHESSPAFTLPCWMLRDRMSPRACSTARANAAS